MNSKHKSPLNSPKRGVVMKKETAIWLIENTSLSFEQIANFCSLSKIEVQALADGAMGANLTPSNPINLGYITRGDIEKCEQDPSKNLEISESPILSFKIKAKKSSYTPIAKRKNKTSAIYWFVKYHPEVKDSKIKKLIGTTQKTIESIRNGTYRGLNELFPKDPSALGLCTAVELQDVIKK